jgi:translation initiation factor IF-2
MAELKLPRLLGAAKEFNIGQDTLIDFLENKGFNDLKPTSKLTEDMYRALQQEFQSDKAAKLKSDLVDLPKGGVAEAKKKKDEEEVLFKKDDKKTVKKEEPKEEIVVTEPAKAEAPPVVEDKEITKVEAPEIEGPKVLDKIDLSAIDSSTRPKKGAKKKGEKEEPAEEVKPPQKRNRKRTR